MNLFWKFIVGIIEKINLGNGEFKMVGWVGFFCG